MSKAYISGAVEFIEPLLGFTLLIFSFSSPSLLPSSNFKRTYAFDDPKSHLQTMNSKALVIDQIKIRSQALN